MRLFPLGKLSLLSQPYAPGGTPVLTTYTYDGLGRTLTVTAPDGSVTTTVYSGNPTTAYEGLVGALVWKRYVRDVFGNLSAVYEPNPDGGADLAASYTYDLLNHLTQVAMARQTVSNPPTNTTRRAASSRWESAAGANHQPGERDGELSLRPGRNTFHKVDAKGQKRPTGTSRMGGWRRSCTIRTSLGSRIRARRDIWFTMIRSIRYVTGQRDGGVSEGAGGDGAWGNLADASCAGPGFVEQVRLYAVGAGAGQAAEPDGGRDERVPGGVFRLRRLRPPPYVQGPWSTSWSSSTPITCCVTATTRWGGRWDDLQPGERVGGGDASRRVGMVRRGTCWA